MHRSAWYPDAAVSSTLSSPPDDYRQFQELLQRMANALEIPLEEVQDSQCQLLDILHASIPERVALPIHNASLQLACAVWPHPTGVEKRYYVPLPKGSEFLFSCPPPSSLLERVTQQHPCSTLADKAQSLAMPMSRKVFSLAGVRVRISNYLARMAKTTA